MTRNRFLLRLRKRTLVLGETTLVMGVLNVTPDSFSDGGHYLELRRAVDRCFEMVDQGADIVDIGGESSRPGAEPVGAEEELDRILPVLEAVCSRLSVPVSVDTWKARVARAAIEAGAEIVNDISALRLDDELAPTLGELKAGVILMHMRGTPLDMQSLPPSPDILGELVIELQSAVNKAYNSGVQHDRIVLDPGIGFGKTAEDNLRIVNRLERLHSLGLPILVGTSRKSFLGKVLNVPIEDRQWGTAASVTLSIVRGAHLVRVHDVAEMVQVVRMTDAMLAEKIPK